MADKDYVKQIITAKELEEKQYWSVKQRAERHDWVKQEVLKLVEEAADVTGELREALRECDDPSFVQPLQRFYLKFGPSGGDQRNPASEGRPPLRAPVNTEYGRFGYTPLDDGGAMVRRVSYSKQRQIGNWNEAFDKLAK